MTTLSDPLIGHTLNGRYRIDSAVARGGMAMVYRGTDLVLDREIAVKVMHRHLLDDETFVERFRREAVTAARLIHPNLTAVHDQGRDGDAVFLVMEYLESVTLRRELKHRGRLTPRQAIVVLDSILAGLEAVHGAGLIHRDLKPDNVLLGAEGQIKLADFGLARAVTAATTTKTLIGTVGYVAPELVTRAGADARTDLYTVGIMFYEMLTGSQPYTDDVPIQVAYRHVHDTVPAPSEAVEGISPLLDAIVLWATSRDPEDRPQDATALRNALAEARAELDEAELDLGHDEIAAAAGDISASESETGDSGPVLTATMTILTEDQPKDRRARTDEIPYLEDDDDAEAGSSESAASPAKTAAASGAAAGVAASATSPTTASASGPRSPETASAESASDRKPKRRRRPAAFIAAAVLVLGLAGAGIASVVGDSTVEVPAVTAGESPDDLIAELEALGLAPATEEVFDSAIPAGRVIGTDPEAGTELEKQSKITVIVSKGEELFGVPDVTGSKEADALTSIESAGMVIGKITREFSDDVAKGDVVSQSVGPDDEVAKGTAVDLVISEGVEPIEVPIVTGLDYDSAFGKLTRLGFRVSKDEVFDDSVPKGKVVSQHPKGGEKRQKDSLVMLKVSKGKEQKDEPAEDASDSAGD